MVELARRQPDTLLEFMNKVEEFINQDYNLTPLNALIHEVLMQIKKDPDYVRPPKITEIHPKGIKTNIALFHEGLQETPKSEISIITLKSQMRCLRGLRE
jgi:hypothetical protein